MQGCAFENLSIEFQTVRKSTRMWGLSRAINEPRSTFLVRGMSTSTSSLQNSFELWLTQHHPSHADADLYNICSNSFESNYSHYSTWSLKVFLMTMYSNNMFGGESEEECAYESWNLWSLMTQRKTSHVSGLRRDVVCQKWESWLLVGGFRLTFKITSNLWTNCFFFTQPFSLCAYKLLCI